MANGLRSLAKAAISATAFFFLLFFLEGHPLLEEKERTIIDDLGQRVKLKGDVKRIVSLVPSNSELVCLLDCLAISNRVREREAKLKGVCAALNQSFDNL